MYIPYVTEKISGGERSYDIFTRLLKDRIILLSGEITDEVSEVVCAELLFLAAEDPEKDISLYINSPGGLVNAGLAIFDTMNFIKPDVSTICMGTCASMAAIILAAGAKGKRFALPNSEVMIHQPLGGAKGQSTEIQIAAENIMKTRKNTTRILSELTNKDFDQVWKDTERDNYLSAAEALEYGLIDKIITKNE